MKILVAGDFCPQNRVAEVFTREDFEFVLGDVKEIIADADYSIVNFECPVTKGGEEPIEKCGPNLQCSEIGMEAVKWAGFDCVTLANNHFLDYGKEGVENTLEACEKYVVDTVGGGMTLKEASKILYKEIDGMTLAIINCCEHEFSIATDETSGSNPLDPIQQYYAIHEARTKADIILVIVHGGNEHYRLPSLRMQNIYRFFVDAGADAVVNHHQHCYSGYEIYNGKPIFYGLGNFLFDADCYRKSAWNEGYMVLLNFVKGKPINQKLYPYVQCDNVPGIRLMDEDNQFYFEKQMKLLCEDIQDKKTIENKYKVWVEANSKWILSLFEPYSSRLAKSLLFRGFLPSYLKGERLNMLLNYLLCESHFDRVKHMLQSIKK